MFLSYLPADLLEFKLCEDQNELPIIYSSAWHVVGAH